MGFYNRYIVPRIVTCACGTEPVLKQRLKVVPKARGQGTGNRSRCWTQYPSLRC